MVAWVSSAKVQGTVLMALTGTVMLLFLKSAIRPDAVGRKTSRAAALLIRLLVPVPLTAPSHQRTTSSQMCPRAKV